MTLHTGRLLTLIISAFSLICISCEDNSSVNVRPEEGMGLVSMSLHSEITVKNTDQNSDDFSDYNFRFVGVGKYGTSDYYRYGSVEWPMSWYFGQFRVQAESCTAEDAESGRGTIRYEGFSTPFDVINGRKAETSVICTIANCRVNVVFEDAMIQSFKDFRLDVTSVIAPVYDEEGNVTSVETPVRTLEYDALDLTGYYNVHGSNMNLKYTLFVKALGADEFIEQPSGYYQKEDDTMPSVVKAGDAITFRVRYTGETVQLPGIMFIVSGERTDAIDDSIHINDYENDNVVEDR